MWQSIGMGALVAVVWAGIGFVIRRVSPWGVLARRYACRRAPAGRRFHLRSAELAKMTFQGMLTLVPAAEGLYLRLTLPVFLGLPPLLVPWSDIEPAAREEPKNSPAPARAVGDSPTSIAAVIVPRRPEPRSNMADAVRLVITGDPPIALGLPRAVWNARPALSSAPLPEARVLP